MDKEQFEFGYTALRRVIEEIRKAEKYIYIVVFQMQNLELLDELIKKAKSGLEVEIITLPLSSINDPEIEKKVREKFDALSKNKGKLNIFDWNVGTTGHTKSIEGDVWYGLHAKFVVTEKSAIILSANITNEPEIDGVLIEESKEAIEDFNKKFRLIKEFYIENKIRDKISGQLSSNQEVEKVFAPPKAVSSKSQKSILHYPEGICGKIDNLNEGLYLFPFDCRGRDFFIKVIEDAEKFAYITSERFTDEDFYYFLEKMKLRGLDIRVVAKFQSQDYQYKILKNSKDLLALGVGIKSLPSLHAKMIVTDKVLALGSVNLNKMNLGFASQKGFWRENTEVMFICKNKFVIEKAKESFMDLFSKSEEVKDKIILKEGGDLKKLLKNVFNISSSKTSSYLAEQYVEKDIENRKKIFNTAKEAERIKEQKKVKKVDEVIIREAEKNLYG